MRHGKLSRRGYFAQLQSSILIKLRSPNPFWKNCKAVGGLLEINDRGLLEIDNVPTVIDESNFSRCSNRPKNFITQITYEFREKNYYQIWYQTQRTKRLKNQTFSRRNLSRPWKQKAPDEHQKKYRRKEDQQSGPCFQQQNVGSKFWETLNNWTSKVGRNVHEWTCLEHTGVLTGTKSQKRKMTLFWNKKMPIQKRDKFTERYLALENLLTKFLKFGQ